MNFGWILGDFLVDFKGMKYTTFPLMYDFFFEYDFFL